MLGCNREGQCGNEDTEETFTPKIVNGVDDAVAIAAGPLQSCAALKDGKIKC
jgi:hypothetical protein